MDPLSIIAGAITVAQALTSGLKTFKTFHDAGIEIDALVEEISEVELVIVDVEKAIFARERGETAKPARIHSVNRLIASAKQKLDTLNAIVNGKLVSSSVTAGETRIARLSWLRQRSNIKRQQDGLRQTRERLSILLDAQSLLDTQLVTTKLDGLAISHEKQAQQLAYHAKEFERMCNHFQTSGTFQQSLSLHASQSNIRHASLEAGPVPVPQINDRRNELGLPRRLSEFGGIADSELSPRPYAAVRSRAPHFRRTPCSGWCSCICHGLTYYQSPQSFDSILGTLLIGHSGVSFKKRPCNEPSCRMQSIPTFRLNFFFPQWMMSRVLQFVVQLSYMKGPELALRIPRVVPDNAPALFYAVQGDIEGMKSLFSKGLASPYDVALDNGRTALHYAVNYKHRELAQFLMDTGASPDVEDKNKNTTIALAWERIFGAADNSSRMVDPWRCMFDDEEYLESRVFPPVHKIVLGLCRADLRQTLEISSSNIDDLDMDGRTALSWAAAKSDARAVEILLEFGANPNVVSHRGHGPLSWAAQSREPGRRDVVEKLLASNADANWADKYNRTPLINSTSDMDDPECLRLLIDHGAEINWQDCHRRTAVCYAAKMNRIANLRYLLETGADYSIPDHWGHTPHVEATYQNHHAALEVLLAKDPLLLPSRLAGGGTVSHIAAAHADAKTFHVLADKADLSLITVDDVDNDRRSFQEVFEARDLVTEELRTAFKHFCSEVLIENSCPVLTDPVDSEDEFIDALEQQVGEFPAIT